MIKGRVLIVAGSDSGGGAGLQADLKTVTALGAYASTAVTAVTVQNTQGVTSVHDIPPEIVAEQIETVLTDIGADVIKTGMLGSTSVVNCVADTLDRLAPAVPRVVDPVMVAKGGHKLITEDAVEALAERLIRGAVVVTPNLPEAEVLTAQCISSVKDMYNSVGPVRDLGANAVLLKGGHADSEDVTDLLITENNVQRFTSPRLHTRSTHGTGCTLASAVAAHLAQGYPLAGAVQRARDFVHKAIKTAPGFGRGHGPLNHAHTFTNSVE